MTPKSKVDEILDKLICCDYFEEVDKGIVQAKASLCELLLEGIGKGQLFENFLMEKHAEQYIGTKDCMIDDYEDWLAKLNYEEYIDYGNQAFADCRERIKEMMR